MQPVRTPTRRSTLAPAWLEARERIAATGSGHPDAFAALAALVDNAGAELQKLQDLYEQDPTAADGRGAWAQLLAFVDGDLTDLMRGVSLDAAALMPGEGWLERADPVEAEGDVELLVRYLTVARMAAEHAAVPPHARAAFREVGASLEGWGERTTRAIQRVAREFLIPARRETST